MPELLVGERGIFLDNCHRNVRHARHDIPCAWGGAGAPVTPGGRRLALLVATGQYADPGLKPLRGPVKEADQLERLLADPDIGGFEVQVVPDGSIQEVRVAIGRFFTEATRQDLLLLHISGHGVKDTRGRLHFATTDTLLDLLNATSLPAEFVRDEADRSPARQVVLWLDCCFSGAFPAGHVPKSGSRIDVVDQLSAKSGRGCLVMTASTHLEHAFESGTGHSPIGPQVPSIFTEAIISGLRSGDADLDADGRIEAVELYNYVYDRVRSRTPHQTPTRNDRSSGPVYLAHSRKGLSLPPALDPDLRAALLSKRDSLRSEAWKILRTSAAAGDLTAIDTLQRLEHDKRARELAPAASKTAVPEPVGSVRGPLEPTAPRPAGPKAATPKPVALGRDDAPAGSEVLERPPAGSTPAGFGREKAAARSAAPERGEPEAPALKPVGPNGGAPQAASLTDLGRPATASAGPSSPPVKRARRLPGRRRLIAWSTLLTAAVLGAAATVGFSLYLSADDGPVVPENGYELAWATGGTPDGQTVGATVGRHVPVVLGSPGGQPELGMILRAHGTPPSGSYLRGTVSVDQKAKLCGPVTILLGVGKVFVTLHVGTGAGASAAVPSSIGPLAGSDRISMTIDSSAATAPPCGAVTLNFENFVVAG
ncbi:caspase family protein [Amycolatopsis sp. NPDC004169]|uniref:caspase family protein n=1 Tax=Amycolatopsis sp. NPDC004169 TaxID=3154453 RepID=UPI0033A7438C